MDLVGHETSKNIEEKTAHVAFGNMDNQSSCSHAPRDGEGQQVDPSFSTTPSTFVDDSFNVEGGVAGVNSDGVDSRLQGCDISKNQGGETSKNQIVTKKKKPKKKSQKGVGWLSRRAIRTKNREARKKRREDKVEKSNCSEANISEKVNSLPDIMENSMPKELSNGGARRMTPIITNNPQNSNATEAAPATSLVADASIGDSGIIAGNNRWREANDRGIAVKLWTVAKESLGVVGNGDDERHIQKIKEMEARDQKAFSQKGKKKSTQ